MLLNYLTRCFWASLALTALALLSSEFCAIVFALVSVSFAILLHAGMKDL